MESSESDILAEARRVATELAGVDRKLDRNQLAVCFELMFKEPADGECWTAFQDEYQIRTGASLSRRSAYRGSITLSYKSDGALDLVDLYVSPLKRI